jgi:hypothetical protein
VTADLLWVGGRLEAAIEGPFDPEFSQSFQRASLGELLRSGALRVSAEHHVFPRVNSGKCFSRT